MLVGGACGAQGGENEPAVERTIPGKPTTTPAPKAPCDPVDLATPALDKKPTVDKGTGEPPAELVTEDITVGTGLEAKVGDDLQMMYTGVLFTDGVEFDSSWKDGRTPFEVSPLGQASVIDGWNQGLVGMKVGGRRKLVIPPALGYGAQDKGSIPPNSTLIFVVDLVQVCPATPVTTLPTVPGSTELPTGSSLAGGSSTTATTAPITTSTPAPAGSSTTAPGSTSSTGANTTVTTAAGTTVAP